MQRPLRAVTALVWGGLALAALGPVALAAFSPYLDSRDATYLIGGFAGIACLSLFLVQPLLAAGYLPGLRLATARRWHRALGSLILIATATHVGGLYLTSPEDTLDALTLIAPTPFSVWGVVALCGVTLTALLLGLRGALPRAVWVWSHNALALLIVAATVLHAVQIEGAMEPLSKAAVCGAALAATVWTVLDLRVLRGRRRGGAG